MKVVHLSTYDLFGGAARAAFRLHAGLRAAGLDSHLLVRQRQANRDDVAQPGGALGRFWLRLQRRIDRAPLQWRFPQARDFSIGWAPGLSARDINAEAADVVHLHWTADGFVRPDAVGAIRAPVVWTMHDMWAFTGGCHYSRSCDRFTAACGKCPLLGSDTERDFSRRGWERRRAAFARRRIVFVAPSHWMAREARRSSLLAGHDVEVIPNGFDTARFSPRDRLAARRALGLDLQRVLILTGAAQLNVNARKGFGDLVEAVERLRGRVSTDALEIAVFGSEAGVPATIGEFRVRNLGVIDDEDRLVTAYAAADVFAAPSRADNLPNTVIEAMSVGIPTVAYAVGGIPEIIDDGVNGLLAAAGQPAALADALARAAEDSPLRARLGQAAREKAVRQFSLEGAMRAYSQLYRRLSERA